MAHNTWPSSAPFPRSIDSLTSLRFLLALGVVLFHYHLQWRYDDMAVTGLFERGRLGVDAFFILSGFVLTHAYVSPTAAKSQGYLRFLGARLARIYPAHLAVLLVFVLMVGGAILLGVPFDRGLFSWAGLAGAVGLVHAWFPTSAAHEWNGPSWSLSAEWFAYIAFPIYAWVGLRLSRRPLLLATLAGLLFMALDLFYQLRFGTILPHAENQLGILRIIPEFLYGVALYRLGERITPSARQAIAFTIGASVVVLLLMHFSLDERAVVACSGAVILGLAWLSKTDAAGWTAHPTLVFAGEASFALYLVHIPVLTIWKNAVAITTDRTSDYAMGPVELILLFATSALAALALHWFIERPARAVLRRKMAKGHNDPEPPVLRSEPL